MKIEILIRKIILFRGKYNKCHDIIQEIYVFQIINVLPTKEVQQ